MAETPIAAALAPLVASWHTPSSDSKDPKTFLPQASCSIEKNSEDISFEYRDRAWLSQAELTSAPQDILRLKNTKAGNERNLGKVASAHPQLHDAEENEWCQAVTAVCPRIEDELWYWKPLNSKVTVIDGSRMVPPRSVLNESITSVTEEPLELDRTLGPSSQRNLAIDRLWALHSQRMAHPAEKVDPVIVLEKSGSVGELLQRTSLKSSCDSNLGAIQQSNAREDTLVRCLDHKTETCDTPMAANSHQRIIRSGLKPDKVHYHALAEMYELEAANIGK